MTGIGATLGRVRGLAAPRLDSCRVAHFLNGDVRGNAFFGHPAELMACVVSSTVAQRQKALAAKNIDADPWRCTRFLLREFLAPG